MNCGRSGLPKKPFCVGWPQDMMCLVWALVAIGMGFTVILLPFSICLAIPLFRRRSREEMCGRELSTFAFILIALLCLGSAYSSDKDDEVYYESESEQWVSGYWKDPADGCVVYSVLFLAFAAMAILPWLPAGNRYYRAIKNEEKVSCEHSGNVVTGGVSGK